MEIFSTVPVVDDRTVLLLRKAVTPGRTMFSVTGFNVTDITVTGVITDVSTSEVTVARLQATANKISNTIKQ
jgi:hypothetical protein